MERKEFEHLNEFLVRGPIVRKFANNVACNFTIKTPRQNMPNQSKEGDSNYYYPEVAFYGKAGKDAAQKYNIGDFVEMTGNIQPQRKVVKETGHDFYEQKLIGQTIKPAETVLMKEFGYEGGPAVEAENKVRLGGIISKISIPARGIVSISIRTFVNNHVSNVQTFIYSTDTQKYMDEFRIGDTVFAVGTIQTLRKEISKGNERYFRNIVLNAICKAK